ncbi:hypothetical protein GCM10022389_20450 [Flavobacterium cheonanense]|uniref:Uncharacterized protein n=1 Tax=Flavobacterium cheonanense TaxID=706183 RepID=A0ABP7VUL1_9FLAO
MAREVTTTGSKKLKTLKKEFNEHFPYLRINIHSSEMALKAKKVETISHLDIEKTLTEVREKTGSGSISFSGRKKVKTIENEFNEIFGLYVQICYTSSKGERFYTTGSDDEKTLTELNRDKEAADCKKDMWN